MIIGHAPGHIREAALSAFEAWLNWNDGEPEPIDCNAHAHKEGIMSVDITDLIFTAALDTVSLIGAMPDGPVDAAAYIRKWCDLMRHHDPQLSHLSDDQIQGAIGRI
jgi:hypothetical protein